MVRRVAVAPPLENIENDLQRLREEFLGFNAQAINARITTTDTANIYISNYGMSFIEQEIVETEEDKLYFKFVKDFVTNKENSKPETMEFVRNISPNDFMKFCIYIKRSKKIKEELRAVSPEFIITYFISPHFLLKIK